MQTVSDAWILMPVIDRFDLTAPAIADCLAQEGLGRTPRILVIDNGSDRENRRGLEHLALTTPDHRVLPLFHNPPMGGPPYGALNASWNYGLERCWALGAERVLVVNNDIRLHRFTYNLLEWAMTQSGGLFVSAVGVREGQFNPAVDYAYEENTRGLLERKGGPDFSCFLISKECHARFPFDEAFTYYGDNDYHRTLVLAGEGERIFGVNIPYLHYGSATIQKSEEFSRAYQKVADEHRARYIRKWGGAPGEEKYLTPFARGDAGVHRPEKLAEVRRLQCEREPLNPEGAQA